MSHMRLLTTLCCNMDQLGIPNVKRIHMKYPASHLDNCFKTMVRSHRPLYANRPARSKLPRGGIRLYVPTSPYLCLLEDRIQIERVPFSDRGSRLLVYRERRAPHALFVKLAERLTSLTPGLSTYRNRPPFISNLRLVDGAGQPQPFTLTTYPHLLRFETPLGEWRLIFQDGWTLSFGLPAGIACGISFSVAPDLARPDARGGEFKSIRNCAYSTNGEVVLNQVENNGNGYDVTLVVVGDGDTAITLHIQAGLDLNRTIMPFRESLRAAEERWDRWSAAVYDEGTITQLEVPVAAAVTKPPIIGWVAMHVFEQTGDEQLLREIYGPLVRWNSWWFGLNDDDSDGIVQYSHPFSSGLDDSPLWDEGVPVEAVDLNTYLCIQMQSLSRMAHVLGRTHETEMWQRKADSLAERMIEHFYDQKAGLFWSQKDHHPIRVVTPFSLYPLWTGRMPAKIAERLVAHLHDPNSFWTPHPLPTVAANDRKYDPQQMWRGPVWININYIFVEALARAGYAAMARDLAERTLALVMGQNDIYEYYHPETGEAPPKAAPMFGWSAACFIDLAVRMTRGEI